MISDEPGRRNQCIAVTKTGKRCQAHKVAGENFCSVHLGRNQGRGAKPGNTNAKKHGFYGRYFDPQEQADLVSLALDNNLSDEIALQRVLNLRLLHYLKEESEKGIVKPEEFASLLKAATLGVEAVARLMRSQKSLDGHEEGDIAGHLADILDQVGAELGLGL